MTCLPSNFISPEFLVELIMCDSQLEKLWEGKQQPKNLKWIDLRCSFNLKELPDISTATNLKELNLQGCSSLKELPISIGKATSLEELDLQGCSSLKELPFSIGNTTSLQKLDLSDCSSLVELPCSIGNIHKLPKLSLQECSKLEVLPTNINLESLSELRNCESIYHSGFWINYTNCSDLNKSARDCNIRLSACRHTLLPGGLVPSYCTYQATGDSVTMKLDERPLPTPMKFMACILLANKIHDVAAVKELVNVICSISEKQNGLAVIYKKKRCFLVLTEHLVKFEVRAKVTSSELLFEFKVDGDKWEIRECGVVELVESSPCSCTGCIYRRENLANTEHECDKTYDQC